MWSDYPCDEWTGCRQPNGYGKRGFEGRTWLVHRLEWTLKRGPIPMGIQVCHHCDNRACREIEHLFLGTQQDNADDMCAKGRQGRKITLLIARQIRDRYLGGGVTQQQLADEHGISRGMVGHISRGMVWA